MPTSPRQKNLKKRLSVQKISQAPRNPAAPRDADDLEQSKAFIEKAREIEADEKHSAADELMGRMAKTKPEPHKAAKS